MNKTDSIRVRGSIADLINRSEQKGFPGERMNSGSQKPNRNTFGRLSGTTEFLFTVPLEFR